ncbi:MAG: hypothetical protein J0I41_07220 [Filimonas sp.]|nr:hypothetical protein [Filimonas sp.]
MNIFKGLLFLSCMSVVHAHAQSADDLNKQAKTLYDAKQYLPSARLYAQANAATTSRNARKSIAYNCACSYALAGNTDSAMYFLEKAVKEYRWLNLAHLQQDSDLDALHQLPAFKKLVTYMEENKITTTDPAQAQLITTDIDRFWKAYDLANGKSIDEQKKIYQQYYLDTASYGLQDYFDYKIRSLDMFVKTHEKLNKFYGSIKGNTLKIATQKPMIISYFKKLKEIYSDAVFSPIYFVIGAFSSGGTSSDNGLLLGADMNAYGPGIDTSQLSLWQRNNLGRVENFPVIVAHECIHFNQGNIKEDTTLLCASLVEGMADFIAELMSGKILNDRQHKWAKGKEYQVWKDFEKEMYLRRARNWIANSDQETPDHPADLGYYMGYQICKAYYDKAADKKQAVYDILHIKDSKAFFDASGFREKMEKK